MSPPFTSLTNTNQRHFKDSGAPTTAIFDIGGIAAATIHF
jgi:hypothetical protein